MLAMEVISRCIYSGETLGSVWSCENEVQTLWDMAVYDSPLKRLNGDKPKT